MTPKKQNTSWGKVADWYANHLKDDDTYHQKVILPNLIRLMNLQKTDKVVEFACGSGFFTKEIAEKVSETVGLDISPELIEIAQNTNDKISNKKISLKYLVAPAENTTLPNNFYDKAVMVLALQNIKNLDQTILEMSRVLKKNGQIYLVLNHPTFRIAGHSSWQFDEKQNIQYRRIDKYMSETVKEIEMNPGQKLKKVTYSFNRPLQVYFKSFHKNGFYVTKLEEWISHKKSQKGKRQLPEDVARKEFPLFMALEAIKSRDNL